jgi:DNA-binding IclR family transcriptional regulator
MPAASATPGAPQGKRPWPKAMAERAQALRTVLAASPVPVTVADLAARFTRAPVADLTELLDTLVLLGLVRRLEDGRCEACR